MSLQKNKIVAIPRFARFLIRIGIPLIVALFILYLFNNQRNKNYKPPGLSESGITTVAFAADVDGLGISNISNASSADSVVIHKPIEWHRPRFEERLKERLKMVRSQMRGIKNKQVLEAMRQVPRHKFVPLAQSKKAYSDHPLPIGEGQTISQPYIVAFMTDALKLGPGDKVLEIGTGSGYQAAVLSEITPEVYSIEILKPLAEKVKKRFGDLGYATIKTRLGDGYHGWKEEAPFDAIIATCASWHVPPPLIKQLVPGGRMIIPVGGVYSVQRLILITKNDSGEVEHRSLLPVRFVPMLGH